MDIVAVAGSVEGKQNNMYSCHHWPIL